MEQDLLTQIWRLKPVHQIWWLKTGPGWFGEWIGTFLGWDIFCGFNFWL
jgi:hypothetical protein